MSEVIDIKSRRVTAIPEYFPARLPISTIPFSEQRSVLQIGAWNVREDEHCIEGKDDEGDALVHEIAQSIKWPTNVLIEINPLTPLPIVVRLLKKAAAMMETCSDAAWQQVQHAARQSDLARKPDREVANECGDIPF